MLFYKRTSCTDGLLPYNVTACMRALPHIKSLLHTFLRPLRSESVLLLPEGREHLDRVFAAPGVIHKLRLGHAQEGIVAQLVLHAHHSMLAAV